MKLSKIDEKEFSEKAKGMFNAYYNNQVIKTVFYNLSDNVIKKEIKHLKNVFALDTDLSETVDKKISELKKNKSCEYFVNSISALFRVLERLDNPDFAISDIRL